MKSIIFLLAMVLVSLTNSSMAQTFKVDVAKSTFKWTGKKVAGSHWGYVKFTDGNLQFANGTLTGGTFNVDMNTIDCQDTPGEWGQKLVGHLKSEDFFAADKFPKSTLVIKSLTAKGNNQFDIKADLTIKGATQEVNFPATVMLSGSSATATANFSIDRTKYGIKYGSGSFFDNLGDKAIDNNFGVEVNLVATADAPVEVKKTAKKATKKVSKKTSNPK